MVRYSGLPFESLVGFCSTELAGAAHAVVRAQDDVARAISRADEALFRAIGIVEHKGRRQDLIRIRRRLRHGRSLRVAEAQLLERYPESQAMRDSLVSQLRRADETLEQFQDVYRRTVVGAVGMLQGFLQNHFLRAGIAQASPDMFEAMQAWQMTRRCSAKIDSVVASLARYVYRSVAKVSPLGTLTMIGECVLDDSITTPASLLYHGPITQSVTVNGYLKEAIWEAACSLSAVRDNLQWRANPTITRDGDAITWYVHVGTREGIRRVPVTHITSRVMNRLRNAVDGVLPDDLVAAIADDSEFTKVDARSAVEQLMRARFILPIAPKHLVQEEWEVGMARWLRSLPNAVEKIHILASLSSALGEMCRTTTASTPAGRVDALTKVHRTVNDALDCRDGDVRFWDPPPLAKGVLEVRKRSGGVRFSRKAIAYQDVRGPLRAIVNRNAGLRFCDSLENFASKCTLLTPVHVHRRALVDFVQRCFSRRPVPVVALLRELQEYRNAVSQRSSQEQEWTLFGAERVVNDHGNRLDGWVNAVSQHALDAADYGDPIRIGRTALDAGDGFLGDWPIGYASSRSVAVQVGERRDGRVVWTLHNPVIMDGFGRSLGRFLYLLPSEARDAVRRWNANTAGADRLIENLDGSAFTANRHPPLTDGVVDMTGHYYHRNLDRDVPLAEIAVEIRDGEPRFVDRRSGARLRVCDLGVQTRGRSSAYEVLSCAAPWGPVYYQALLAGISNAWCRRNTERGDQIGPRIELGDDIVLQRRRWAVPSWLRQTAKTSSAAEWILALAKWQDREGLPNTVFYRTPLRREDRVTRHRKPQYMAFGDPLACELFRRVAGSSSSNVRVEEMYPTLDMCPRGPAGHYATEVSVTWYSEGR